ncbi:hypothetical protein L917_01008, partial [Phytophthora nicotianae]
EDYEANFEASQPGYRATGTPGIPTNLSSLEQERRHNRRQVHQHGNQSQETKSVLERPIHPGTGATGVSGTTANVLSLERAKGHYDPEIDHLDHGSR